MSCLYILEIRLLLVMSFANIFFQSIGHLFVLSVISFAVQNLCLIRIHLFIFAYFHCLGRPTQENIGKIYVRQCFCLCSFRGVLWCDVFFMVLCLLFKKQLY